MYRLGGILSKIYATDGWPVIREQRLVFFFLSNETEHDVMRAADANCQLTIGAGGGGSHPICILCVKHSFKEIMKLAVRTFHAVGKSIFTIIIASASGNTVLRFVGSILM